MAARRKRAKAPTGTGYCVETLALSVFNLLSRARRPMSGVELFEMLRQPHVWDPRITAAEVDAGCAHLMDLGWAVRTGDVFDLRERHPSTRYGRDVVRDPTDPRGAKLLMLGAYQ